MFDKVIDVEKFLDAVDNPIMRGVLAAGGTAALIAATTAFAPIGVVGATGWTLVYWVFGGTITLDAARRMWDVYTKMSTEKREQFDKEMDKLKRMLDDEAISKEEFNEMAKNLYEKYAG
ncbi:hypothetical protein C9J01_11320 [Photobacterium rosenbergii]|uniref:SHOCT domain-containing protein n=1 Tax=Photobacterium rosenbergii TaxID=294936 RepID=A0A2T3NFR1_9GAMM|nr:hypothetical protein [Photobacterium rosenbergii]PSW13418.1 hypothetical protein C9J01_11320 [Photobacterium rosenbergii]